MFMFALKEKLNLNFADFSKTIEALRLRCIEELSIAHKKIQDIPGTNFELGLYHLRLGNISDAVFRFKLVCWLRPGHAEAHYYLAKSLILIAKNEAAKKAIDAALSIRSPWPEAQFIAEKLTSPSKINAVPPSVIKEHIQLAHHRSVGLSPHSSGLKKRARVVIKNILSHIQDTNPKLEVLELATTKGIYGIQLQEQQLSSLIDATTAFYSDLSALTFANKPIYRNTISSLPDDYLQEPSTEHYHVIIADRAFDYSPDLSLIFNQLDRRLHPQGIAAVIIRIHSSDSPRLFNITTDTFTFSSPAVSSAIAASHLTLVESAPLAQFYEEASGNILSEEKKQGELPSLSSVLNTKKSSDFSAIDHLFLCKKTI